MLVIDLGLVVLCSISHLHLLKSESLIRRVLTRLHFCWLWRHRLHFLIFLLLLYLDPGAGACRLLALELARGQVIFWKLLLLFLLFLMWYRRLHLLDTLNLFLLEQGQLLWLLLLLVGHLFLAGTIAVILAVLQVRLKSELGAALFLIETLVEAGNEEARCHV